MLYLIGVVDCVATWSIFQASSVAVQLRQTISLKLSASFPAPQSFSF